MTDTQNPDSTNSQGNQQNSLNRLIESIKRNKTVLIGATLAGFMSNFIGFIVDIVEFKTLINPEPTDLSHEWVLVKITGYSVASYDFAEQPGTDMLKAFFTNKLEGISKLTPMIYTDHKPTDLDLSSGKSQNKDFSVLKNVDYVGQLPGAPRETVKRNSQTFQARLIQASKNEEPVCLRVYGKRGNNNSEFFNIVEFKTVKQEIQNEYNNLKNKNNSQKDYKELTERACLGDRSQRS
jgi:hypothetical protein